MEKKPCEKPASSLLANERTVYDYDSGSIIGQIGLERSEYYPILSGWRSESRR